MSDSVAGGIVSAPVTLEGWYALHQLWRVDRRAWREQTGTQRTSQLQRAISTLSAICATSRADGESAAGAGWTALVALVGSDADLMTIHFRNGIEALSAAEETLRFEPLFESLELRSSFLSVTEAGLYHLSAQVADEAQRDGEDLSAPKYQERLREEAQKQRASAFVQRRLYPQLPPDMPFVCFYPMSKKRDAGQNWYTLSLAERSRLMLAHGKTGRQYAGKVLQIITGAIGFDAWEWGVTLFAADPLEFKRIVTEMRFDEVSAKYAEFGDFYVGQVVGPEEWVRRLG